MIHVLAVITAQPGKRAEVLKAFNANVPAVRAEKGCINYDLHVSPDDPGLLVFHENWESKADLDAHLASVHIDAFRAVAPDLLAEPPDITLWTEVKD